jgi:hypothetical protein
MNIFHYEKQRGPQGTNWIGASETVCRPSRQQVAAGQLHEEAQLTNRLKSEVHLNYV